MEAESRWYSRRIAPTYSLVVFIVVLLFADWPIYAASFVLFKLAPSAVPENFHIMVAVPESDQRPAGYDVITWKSYPAAGTRTFLLPETMATLPGKATYSFTVLKSTASYQLVQVAFDGPYDSVSRYEAYADRVVPVAYRSIAWGEASERHWLVFLIGVVVASLAAWAAAFAAKRLGRVQQT